MMGNTYGNLAYDLDKVSSSEKKLKVVQKPKYKKKIKLSVIYAKNMCMCALIAVSATSIICEYTNLAVATSNEGKLKNELEVLQSEEISLNAQVENMFNLGYIESYAKNNLNMISVDNTQIEQVYIGNDDEIKASHKFNASSVLENIFNNLMEYIK